MKTAQEFVNALNLKFNRADEPILHKTFVLMEGPKYTRVVCVSCSGNSRSAFAFIDAAGNVFKPAGWKGPAKGIRATLATLDMTRVDEYGGWLYRYR